MRNNLKPLWIKENFGLQRQNGPNGSQIFTAPKLYALKDPKIQTKGPFTRTSTGRYRYILQPVEIQSPDLKSACEDLYAQIRTHHKRDRLCIYLPKDGQDPNVVQPGEPFEVIQENDVLHSHQGSDSKHLMDFGAISLHGLLRKKVEKGTLSSKHTHLLIPDLAI